MRNNARPVTPTTPLTEPAKPVPGREFGVGPTSPLTDESALDKSACGDEKHADGDQHPPEF